jgi:hypothetical protein
LTSFGGFEGASFGLSDIIGPVFKNRKKAVSAPIDLVPSEMQWVHLELLKDGSFYALTFRKPNDGDPSDAAQKDKLDSPESKA